MPQYSCQKCHRALELDDSLRRLTSAQSNLLTNITTHDHTESVPAIALYVPKERLELFDQVSQKPTQPLISRDLTDNTLANSNFSYIDVAEEDDLEDDVSDLAPISQRIANLTHIFQILSTNQGIDHPLCSECAGLLAENLKIKFDQSLKEKENYISFLKKLRDRDTSIDISEVDDKLASAVMHYKQLEDEERAKLDELEQLELTKRDLDKQLSELNEELDHLNRHELRDVLRLRNKLDHELARRIDKLDQSKAVYQMHLDNLDKLRMLNMYTRLFDISFEKDSEFGTINGLRLGYKVPWLEISAALGQVILLLVFLIKRLDLRLENYRLVPMGSRSQIVKLLVSSDSSASHKPKSKTVLNLYSVNEFSLGKLFNYNKLDVAMIALLDVVSHITNKLSEIDLEIEFPFAISPKRDSIGGRSIRVTSNGEWTHACKNLLTDLNWILAYTSAHTSVSTS